MPLIYDARVGCWNIICCNRDVICNLSDYRQGNVIFGDLSLKLFANQWGRFAFSLSCCTFSRRLYLHWRKQAGSTKKQLSGYKRLHIASGGDMYVYLPVARAAAETALVGGNSLGNPSVTSRFQDALSIFM